MKINEIKAKMKSYRDFYGGDLLNVDEIDSCNTRQELKDILWKHEAHMESMLCDARSHLNNFTRSIDLHIV